ncbi:MAG: DNA translocase FtsK [candidate division Zixibacteria bacterium]|nr:DNA translocase FtsK [candidate division Zixibacteria bacterium]
MASRKKSNRGKQTLGVVLVVVALFVLVALVTHETTDDARISGEVDGALNPWEINYANQGGMFGAYLSFVLYFVVGWLSFFIPLGLISVSLGLFSKSLVEKTRMRVILLFVVALCATMMINVQFATGSFIDPESGAIGGYIGRLLTVLMLKLVGTTGTLLILGGLVFVLLLLYTVITPFLLGRLIKNGTAPWKKLYLWPLQALKSVFSFKWAFRSSKKAEIEDDDEHVMRKPEPRRQEIDPEEEPEALDLFEEPAEKTSRRRTTVRKPPEPVQVTSFKYDYPPLDLLEQNPDTGTAVSQDELNATSKALKDTLETFGVNIDGPIEKYPGPIITRYEFKPGVGIKVNQIVNLADDLALALKAKRIRIIAPIPGKAAVGVEIPNRTPQMVYCRDILSSEEFNNPSIRLPMALGKTTSGKPYVADLTKMPHLLIAGATGSGKSVCMNVLITSLIYRMHPLQVRFIFVDPKMLELSVYQGLPHLGRAVVTTPRGAEKVLADAVVEMETRYRRLATAGVRNIEDFNKKQAKEEDKLPYIVIFVDELADLMMSSQSSKTEMLITRLAQMARAVGIHLILATQRPSVDVITGLIKANFPARIAFQVATKVDSRTIIDANGAEKLLGSGDMLFLFAGQPEPIRVHGAWLSSEETDKIVHFIREQKIGMLALQGISQTNADKEEAEVDLGDPLFREACEVVIRHKQGSVSLLQRRLGIGYQRAARLIDKLEEAGIVSPFDGSKAREVIVDKTYLETLFAAPAGAGKADSDLN